MDQRRALTDVGGSNDTPNMRSNDQRRYRVIADKDSTPDLVSAHAAPGDRLVYDVIDDDRWSLVRIERPVEGAEPPVQPPTREQIAEAIYTMRAGSKQNWHKAAFRDDYLKEADAVLALFPQPAPRAEPTVQVPVSLIERAKEALLEVPPSSRNADIYGELSALLSQPNPTGEPPMCAEKTRIGDYVHACVEDAGHDGRHMGITGVWWGTPAEPPRIADMVPGTSFGSTVDSHNTKVLRFMRTSEGAVDEDGTYWPVADIDPSTIRDVTPPPATPEEADRG